MLGLIGGLFEDQSYLLCEHASPRQETVESVGFGDRQREDKVHGDRVVGFRLRDNGLQRSERFVPWRRVEAAVGLVLYVFGKSLRQSLDKECLHNPVVRSRISWVPGFVMSKLKYVFDQVIMIWHAESSSYGRNIRWVHVVYQTIVHFERQVHGVPP